VAMVQALLPCIQPINRLVMPSFTSFPTFARGRRWVAQHSAAVLEGSNLVQTLSWFRFWTILLRIKSTKAAFWQKMKARTFR